MVHHAEDREGIPGAFAEMPPINKVEVSERSVLKRIVPLVPLTPPIARGAVARATPASPEPGAGRIREDHGRCDARRPGRSTPFHVDFPSDGLAVGDVTVGDQARVAPVETVKRPADLDRSIGERPKYRRIFLGTPFH